jgi:plasmid stabilization system protein ParE
VARLSEDAIRAVAELQNHYEQINRPEATRNLRLALERASARIDREPEAGLPAPRPYPEVARPEVRWIKEGRYWIAYTTERVPMIVGVFYDTANIPGRL